MDFPEMMDLLTLCVLQGVMMNAIAEKDIEINTEVKVVH